MCSYFLLKIHQPPYDNFAKSYLFFYWVFIIKVSQTFINKGVEDNGGFL